MGTIRIESAKALETGRSRIGRARCRSGFSSANFRILRRIQWSAVAISAMRRAWIRKVKGSRLVNAVAVFSCEENVSPLCFSHSVPRLVLRLQMGGLSLTKIFFNARVSAWSIEDRAVRTRASCSERWLCNVKTWSRPTSAACCGPLNGADDTLHALQDWRGRCGLFRRLERCLPGLVQLIQTHELHFPRLVACRVELEI